MQKNKETIERLSDGTSLVTIQADAELLQLLEEYRELNGGVEEDLGATLKKVAREYVEMHSKLH